MMASYVLCWLWSNKILYISHVPNRCTLAFVTSCLTTNSLSFVWDDSTSSGEVSQLFIDIGIGAVSNINSFCKYTRTWISVIHSFFEIILKVHTQCYVPNQWFYVPGKPTRKPLTGCLVTANFDSSATNKYGFQI